MVAATAALWAFAATVDNAWAGLPSLEEGRGFHTLQFSDRVYYQERIERIYFNHRTGTKLPFERAVPRKALEEKVEKYLLQDSVVGPAVITDGALQKELERICGSTRAPAMLREIFGALENNAWLVKEVFVRPILAEKMSRGLYDSDGDFHAPERQRAEMMLAKAIQLRGERMEEISRTYDGEYGKIMLRAVPARVSPNWPPANVPLGAPDSAIDVDEEFLSRRYAELNGTENAPELLVTEDAFIIERLANVIPKEARRCEKPDPVGGRTMELPGRSPIDWQGRSPLPENEMPQVESLEIESIILHKRTYETWLKLAAKGLTESARNSYFTSPVKVDSPATGIEFQPLPTIISSTAACAPDTWADTRVGVPAGRYNHTAVWTGTEMIIWGGIDPGYSNTGSRFDPAADSWTAITKMGAPSGRYNHTAVWTGTEMVVWGGYDSVTGMTNSGGRYNPNLNSWTATTLTGAPSARRFHTAVWTGSEMVVWGGYDFSTNLNTGGRYNPATNSWTTTTTTGAPSGRQYHTAVWTGTKMVVWGGYNGGVTYFNTGGRYDPTANSWTPTTTTGAPAERYAHTAVWTGTEMIVWGGPIASNTGGRYDPAANSWMATTTTGAPSGNQYHTAVWTGTEMIVWGGWNGSYLSTGGRYAPATNSWTPTATSIAPSARYQHTAIWTGAEMVVWGGRTSATYFDTGGRYDPAANSWLTTSTLSAPSGRYHHTAVWTGAEMIVWGGYGGGPTGGRYDLAANFWTPTTTTDAPSGREGHTALWTGAEMIVWGGFDNTGGRYNPAADSWIATTTTGAPSSRGGHTVVWTGTEMVVWGGWDFSSNVDTGGRYNPVANSWAATTTIGAPAARVNHTAVWTGTEMVVWGGDSSTCCFFNTGGLYNPATNSWAATTVTGAPLGRGWHSAVWTGTEMIVWGGENWNVCCVSNTGGRYDPAANSWLATTTTGAPSGRSWHTAVWTGAEMIVWGGFDGSYLNTGGRYDPAGNSWMPTATTGVWPGREYHTAVWTGNEMIVWGGWDGISVIEGLNLGSIYFPACPCLTPGSPTLIYRAGLNLSGHVVLNFTDSNAPSNVTGYNVYRSAAATGPWTKIGSNAVDTDPGTPNIQIVDSSGESCGGMCYFEVAAYNANCNAEGPW